ncbi:MAG TPA: glycosyltransferase [Actinomycetota bacterium]|jgi:glycosyltransferase involved in cell wall biosynthesis
MIRDRLARLARRVLSDPGPPGPGSVGEVLFCGPLPPAATGVASYDRAVLDGLERIGFMRRHRVDVVWPFEPRMTPRLHGYQLGVFQIGNNAEYHLEAYRAAYVAPASLIVLHDLALDDFVAALRTLGDPLAFKALREAQALQRNLTSPDVVRNEPLRVPWAAHVARRARGIVVHADFGRRYLQELGCRTPVFVVPHPPIEDPAAIRRAEPRARELRAGLEARGMRALVVAPGDLNAAKQLEPLLAAVGGLGDGVHVALVGRRIPGYDPEQLLRRAGLGSRATLATDVTDDEFRAWLVASDVVVDLRHPTRGETSGSLSRAMQAGKPAIVSATGAYLDVPEELVVHVPAGVPDPAELGRAIAELLADEDRRARMGAAARAHVEGLAAAEATARGYEEAIEATLALAGDPAHAALGIWAKSLADMGVDEATVAEGIGVDYARAFDAFRRSPSDRRGPDEGPLLDSSAR